MDGMAVGRNLEADLILTNEWLRTSGWREQARAVSFSKGRTEGEIGETKFENRELKKGMSVLRLVA